jgi:hypothetical protein
MSIRKNFAVAFLLGAIVLFFSQITFGQAAPTESPALFSLYGIQSVNFGQTLRVAVQNPKLSDSEIIPCVRVRIVFDVYDNSPTEGGRLRFIRRVSREVLLDAGEAASFDFPASRTGDLVSTSILARAEGSDLPANTRPRIASTLSVREAGRTILNLPAVIRGFDPQPDPPSTLKQ